VKHFHSLGLIKKIFIHLIDLIYPPRCPLCNSYLDKEKELFCEKCLAGFRRLLPPFCSICAVPFDGIEDDMHVCEDCLRKRPSFKSISAPYIYKNNNPISTAIHLFKYRGNGAVSKALGRLLAGFALEWWDKRKRDYILVPVPLSPNRLRQRGFNQSLVLARHVAEAIGLPVDYMSLRRIKDTPPQSILKKEDRKKNVRNAFKVAGNSLRGKKVILVDDVATTGTTLNECAKVLKRSGVKEVICLVFARTDPKQQYL